MKKRERFLLATIQPQDLSDDTLLAQIEELGALVDSYGAETVGIVVQKREVHDKGLYLGTGKVMEIGERLVGDSIDVVVLNGIVKATHLYEIKTKLLTYKDAVEVWDRADLILHIFAHHARTTEARLQIELAAMRHMGPRIYGMGSEMSRQAGGIGARGIGETNTELMKRHWHTQMQHTQEKLDKMMVARRGQMERRRRSGLKTVSLVGYTNAGKTSLYNLLVGKRNIVQNALFVTLDSSVGRIYLPLVQRELLVSDTIGFIQDLPLDLIEAFKSTLLEALSADVLLHVIDVSDPQMMQKIETVAVILDQLGLSQTKTMYIFNKMDLSNTVDQEMLMSKFSAQFPQFISVNKSLGIDNLLEKLSTVLDLSGN
jgi:GTP-binding protein HflX